MAIPTNLTVGRDGLIRQPNEQPQQLPTLSTAPKTPTEKRVGPFRGYVTPGNARYLAFAGMFPGADKEAFSILTNRQENRFAPAGELPTIGGAEKRLRKLVKLEALNSVRDAVARKTIYSLSPLGFGYAREFGYNMDFGATLHTKAKSRLRHYRMIAHVAAQFASPAGFFKDTLGVDPVDFESLITEQQMIAQHKQLMERLKRDKRNDFGRWRTEEVDRVLAALKAGKITWEDITEFSPALRSIGFTSVNEDSKLKPLHQPDLVVELPRDSNGHSNSLLVEIELSKKPWADYHRILATLKEELKQPFMYKRCVYFTIGNEIPNILKKVNAAGEYGLIESGKLVILPIRDREGIPLANKKDEYADRVIIGGN